MACSDNKNPLQRGGTSQQQRLLAGLSSGYVNVDERDFSDWIVFADAFAEYLNYYSLDNKLDGNWKPFFDNDISAILGSIAIQDIDAYRRSVKERFRLLQGNDHIGDTQLLRETFASLFGCILTLAKSLDSYLVKIPASVALRDTIRNLVSVKLAPTLGKLLSYYKGASSPLLLKELDFPQWKVLNLPVQKPKDIINEGLSQIWVIEGNDWTDYYTNFVEKDSSVYGAGADVYQRINHAVNHNLFSGLFDQFLSAFARIVKDAESQLLDSLTGRDDHPPHYALFLAFLRLFRYAQEGMNTLTQRHLDYYYKEILQLMPKPAQPDHVHLVAELAKQTENYLLKQQTLFKAGKDSAGKDVVYALDRDTLFNKATVSGLMAVYRGNNADNYKTPANTTVNNTSRLFAAPVINSADGLGEKLKTPQKEWHPFINKQFTEGKLTDITMPEAAIGFGIASPHLFLTEGDRRVYFNLVTASGAIPFANLLAADCYVTTEKGWFQVPAVFIKKSKTTSLKDCTTIYFTLQGDAPAITNYNTKTHGGNFTCTTPLAKIILKNDTGAAYTYEALKNVVINEVEVLVRVGYDDNDTLTDGGLKNLLLSGDAGALDPAKPFLPFGPLPKTGGTFTVGNEEVFRKKNASMQLRIQWTDMPAHYWHIDFEDPDTWDAEGTLYPQAKLQYLSMGLWKDVSGTAFDMFNQGAANINFPVSVQQLNDAGVTAYTDTYLPYDIKSRTGFIRMVLQDDFRHKWYQDTLTAYLIDQAKPEPTHSPGKPNPPYTPTIAKISLHYKAAASSVLTSTDKNTFNNRGVQFFHIYPFGEAEQHNYLTGNAATRLLPQFSHTDADGAHEHVGEFYVGLQQIEPGQSVNILFQVMEGTTNPLLDKPEKHISWSYLTNNTWKLFDRLSVSDNTAQLVQSGIISFILPDDITTAHTVMPTGNIWLRASVNENAEAVCKLLGVHAQAAIATFSDNGNAADFLNTALPAETIAKLKEPVSAIKKITQPYPSFGGKPAETDGHFYTRASERLRHKNRAITIWDYEHLVLEAFPDIHRVKCLNHTKYIGNDYNEIAPGYVTVITIPNLVNRNDANPLRPYTNQGTLTQIEEYLKQRISCHVNLNVRHPLFEEVMMDFKLKVVGGLEFNYYSNLLKQEITEFLTPWAFGRTDDVRFGGQISKSTLINFIEERSYVDYITDVKMYHRVNEVLVGGDLDMIAASTARSILVSVQASLHNIVKIPDPQPVNTAVNCVDTWTGPPNP